MTYEQLLKTVMETYREALKTIDGITTGRGVELQRNGREYKIYIWEKVKKNLIASAVKQYWDNPSQEVLNIGCPLEFDYSIYDKEGIVLLDGKIFKGLFK